MYMLILVVYTFMICLYVFFSFVFWLRKLCPCVYILFFRMAIFVLTSVVDKLSAKVSVQKKIEEMELQTLELSARVT